MLTRRRFLSALGIGAASVAVPAALVELVEREPVRRFWQVPRAPKVDEVVLVKTAAMGHVGDGVTEGAGHIVVSGGVTQPRNGKIALYFRGAKVEVDLAAPNEPVVTAEKLAAAINRLTDIPAAVDVGPKSFEVSFEVKVPGPLRSLVIG